MKPIAVFAMLLVATLPGLAQPATDYVPMTQDIDGHTWGIVCRKEVTLFGIPVPAGGFDVGERARIIADERLDVLYDGGVLDKPKNIRVGKINGEVTIYVKNPDRVGNLPSKCLILTIDSNFEQFLGKNRWDTAYYWRDIMRKWSRKGLMKAAGGPDDPNLDPAGRPLDKANSWRNIPDGFANKADKNDDDTGSTSGGGTAPVSGGGATHGGGKIPGAD